uniref:Putative secreted peptide n=1 Tax=Anopheles braziliensis TaxID=58242 RepID=A0A2M3ZUL9_9DIPT
MKKKMDENIIRIMLGVFRVSSVFARLMCSYLFVDVINMNMFGSLAGYASNFVCLFVCVCGCAIQKSCSLIRVLKLNRGGGRLCMCYVFSRQTSRTCPGARMPLRG